MALRKAGLGLYDTFPIPFELKANKSTPSDHGTRLC